MHSCGGFRHSCSWSGRRKGPRTWQRNACYGASCSSPWQRTAGAAWHACSSEASLTKFYEQGLEVLGFGIGEGGRGWALLVKAPRPDNEASLKDLAAVLDAMVWEAWGAASSSAPNLAPLGLTTGGIRHEAEPAVRPCCRSRPSTELTWKWVHEVQEVHSGHAAMVENL
jgi:hypothetical protein